MVAIKKYWPLAVAVAAILFSMRSCQIATDRVLAAKIAEQSLEKLRVKIVEISKKYGAEYAKLDKQIEAAHVDLTAASERADRFYAESKAAQKKIKEIQSVNDQLQATNVELELCQQFVIKQRDDYVGGVAKLDLSYNAKMDAMRGEFAEKESTYKKEIVGITKSLAWYAVKDKRRWVFGPQAGYGVRGFYVGVGITFRVLEFGF